MIRILAVLATVICAGSAAAQEDAARPPVVADPAALSAMTARAVDGYIIPAFGTLRAAASGMEKDLAGGCDDPDALRPAFVALIRAWAGVDFLHFGPMLADSRYERFAFWPDPHGTGTRQLRRLMARPAPDLLEPGAIARQSAALQGLPALEALLFAPPSTDPEAARFRCDLARAVAANLETLAGTALEEWTKPGGWRALMLEPGAGNPVYRSEAEAATEVLKAILTGLEQLRDQRIRPPLGETREQVAAAKAPYATSGLTLAYWAASGRSLAAFTATSDFAALAPDDQRWIGASIGFEFENLQRALDGAQDPVASALLLEPSRGRLLYAVVVLASLRELFQMRLAPAVGLSAGFNALDGD